MALQPRGIRNNNPGNIVWSARNNWQGQLPHDPQIEPRFCRFDTAHNADSSNSGEGARREAGPLLGRLVKALTGWAPAIDVAPLARSARQSPATYASGYLYFPLVFTARFVYPRIKSWKP